MATNASKIDAAAEKAYAEAAAKKTEAKPVTDDVSIKAIAEAVEADKPAEAGKPASAKAPTKKAAVKKPARKAAVKKAAPAKKVAATKKTADKTASAKRPTSKRKPIAETRTTSTKETIMTKAQDKAANLASQAKAQAQESMADIQARAKTAFDKSSEIANEMGEFTKGNVEAVVESGKILAAGMQDIAKNYVADGKNAVETMTADVKEVAAVKSPTEFVQLQSKIASRNFDATVATFSKNTETFVKLANDAFAPISGRMSLAMEKVRKAA
ncbi:phasin family protein [Pontixanthobacter sp.]|uniref:phasin family protein n=1 Tax=Pontixanthobacter sp. TaxID=2792078 RepID=UPI003C7B8443